MDSRFTFPAIPVRRFGPREKPDYARVDYSYRMPSSEELEAMMTPEMKAVREDLARRVQAHWDAMFSLVLNPSPLTLPPDIPSDIEEIRFDIV